jgi:16S rRNA (guanine527-N7)-methyltransferase
MSYRETLPIDLLSTELEKLGITALDTTTERLSTHWELVYQWNKTTNLTAIVNAQDALQRHYLDSLAALPRLKLTETVVDMGSGAGFPGLVLASCLPKTRFVLVEPRRKRASFLEIASARMGLDNVQVIEARSDSPPALKAGAVVTRATFSDDSDIVQLKKWLQPGGVVIAYQSLDGPGTPDETVHYTIEKVERRLAIWHN